MTLLGVLILTSLGAFVARVTTQDASFGDFELRLEAAVLELSYPGFTDVLGGSLLVEEDSVVERKMRKVLEAANHWEERNGAPEGGVKVRPPAAKSKRSSCPGGTGSYGFNTFNFLTFALQVFNGVVNAINRINNNNNNNNDNSQNNVNVNTDQVSTNSNSANSVMVIIPPAPGRRRRHQVSSCNSTEVAAAVVSLLQRYSEDLSNVPEACRELRVCSIVRQVAFSVGFEAVYWRLPRGPLRMDSAPCEFLFRDCSYDTQPERPLDEIVTAVDG